MYNEKPQLKLYKYINSAFTLVAIVDDYHAVSFERNKYQAGQFMITINFNIPNASKFERGMFVQFGNDAYDFGEITEISDTVDENGKGGQLRNITGYDARYIFHRRIIRNLNANETWQLTAKGELCIRNLILDQCGANAEAKRQLPVINTIPQEADAIGAEYSVSEAYTNLYEVLVVIATQSEIGWRLVFDGENLTLDCYEGTDRSATVKFDTDVESLANGNFTDSSESFANAVFVGGKGEGSERDIYEGESAINGQSPAGLERFEAWDDQTSLTVEDEYETEALAMLAQYGQTLTVSGQGLAKCPYIYKKQYDVGDIITVAFSGKSAKVQILSVTEVWTGRGDYAIEFSFGKPVNNLSDQLQLILKQIQAAKTNTVASVKWYTTPTDTTQDKSDVSFGTLGFTGSGGTFTLYLDDEQNGAKEYYVYYKNLTGAVTLTTGNAGTETVTIPAGNGIMTIYVNEDGDVIGQSVTTSNTVADENTLPVTSDAVYDDITSRLNGYQAKLSVTSEGWIKICTIKYRNRGIASVIKITKDYHYGYSASHIINLAYGWLNASMTDLANDVQSSFTKMRVVWNNRDTEIGVYIYYARNLSNTLNVTVESASMIKPAYTLDFKYDDPTTWAYYKEFNLGKSGLYVNGDSVQENYSTSEQKTGKYWIDGKSIYRIVVNQNLTLSQNTWVSTSLSNANIEKIIDVIGLQDTGTVFKTLNANRDTGSYVQLQSIRTTNFSLTAFILEYTKTSS